MFGADMCDWLLVVDDCLNMKRRLRYDGTLMSFDNALHHEQ